jgi:hypothetical protein
MINRLRKFWRSRDRNPQAHGDSDINARLAQLDDPTSELSHIWNREHDQYVLRQLLALAEPHFEPTRHSVASHWKERKLMQSLGKWEFLKMPLSSPSAVC